MRSRERHSKPVRVSEWERESERKREYQLPRAEEAFHFTCCLFVNKLKALQTADRICMAQWVGCVQK